MLRRWRSLAGLSLTAGLVLIMSAVGALPVAAGDHNRGDVWTQQVGHPEETPKGHSQEVHLACDAVDIWADDLDSQSGTWILYHLPPPNPPPPGTVVTNGTYSYSGHTSQIIATIPKATFQGAAGPHFKIELDNNKSKTFWVECGPVQPTLTTTPNPETATIGQLLKDNATLAGNLPTGTITFTLYNPSNTAVFTRAVAVNDDGTYSTPDGYIADAVGGWHWSAVYSGDDNNNKVTSADEPVTVNQAVPTISTTQHPDSGHVGDTLQDTAHLAGYQPTGSITFYLNNSAGHNIYHETVDVTHGDGDYSTGDGYTASAAGTFYWVATYHGDTNNQAASSGATDEPVTITEGELKTTITTTPIPGTAKVGDVLKDKATLGNTTDATGTITFTLIDPNGHEAYHQTVDVSKYHTDYTTPDGFMAYGPGPWYWTAEYSGDAHNQPATSGATDELVTVTQAQPTISTTQHPDSGHVGDTFQDTAHLAGYHPTGTITFYLNNSAGHNVFHDTVDVTHGNGDYSTDRSYTASLAGTFYWVATYHGDANNQEASSGATDEPVTITEGEHPAQPSISTVPLPGTLIAVGSTLHDSATLSEGTNPTGTITFTLYKPNNVAVHTEPVTVNGNGVYTTSEGHVVDMVGAWHWSAKFTSSNQGANGDATSADEAVTVDPAQPAISTTPNLRSVTGSATLQDTATLTGGFQPTGKIVFNLYDNNGAVAYTEEVTVDEGNSSYSTTTGHLVNTPGIWHWSAAYSGDVNNKAVHSLMADEAVTVTGTGEVLAATGMTPLTQVMALAIIGFGAIAILTAVAWRRRES